MMKKEMKIFLKLSILVVYALFLNRICELLQYGGVRSRLPIVVVLFLLLLILAGVTFFISRRQKESNSDKKRNSKEKALRYTFIIIAGIITINAGYNIYLSGTNYGGKLAWYLDELFHQEKIELQHDNLYETGIDGIIEDIEARIDLPKQLYLGDSLSLHFNQDGVITKFEFSVYGRNEKNEKGYLIVFDKEVSDKMTVYKETHAGDSFKETQQLAILQDTVNAVFLNRPFQA